MIRISCKNERFTYDMYHIVKSFLPDAEISQKVDPEQELLIEMTAEEEPDLEEQACDKKVRWTFFHCREAEIADISEKREQKRYINKKLYQTLVKKTGEEHAWGNMTGVRPTKMIMERLEEGSSEEEIIRYMHDTYVVSEKKAMLGIEIAKREKAQLDKLDYENGYSLYIGIPFCPTTCSYCSFTSYPVAKWQDRMDEYVDALLKELAFIAEVSKEKHLNAIYMGGGTPTTLSAQQMDRVLSFLEEHFSFEHLKEYTIEAGRPDSITEDKLRVIRKHGVGRISINPQTMQQKTLDVIVRRGRCSPHFPSGKRTGIRQYQYGSDRRSSGRTSGGDGRYSSSDQRACTGQFDGPCTCNETWFETDTRTGCKHRKTKLQTDGKRAGRDDRYGT